MYKIDVYDFDGTIYDGDSTIDFFLFALKKNKKIIGSLPIVFTYYGLHFLKIISTKKFKEKFFIFLKYIDVDKMVMDFWQEKQDKINKTLLKKHDNNKRVVISASPEFLLKPYLEKYDNLKVIGTKYQNNQIVGENCKGKEKINRLKKVYKKFEIGNCYTDSLTDLPLLNLASNPYYVHNKKIEKWNTKKIKNKRSIKLFTSLFIFLILLVSIYFLITSF